MPFGKADSPALALKERHYGTKAFVPAGQSTQMIVGATPENDFQMLFRDTGPLSQFLD